jgi:hypothetical protein
MLIDEDKEPAGSGTPNLGKLLPARNIRETGLAQVAEVLGITVDRLAHIVAAVPRLPCGLAARRFDGRFIRRTVVDGDRRVILE